MNKTELWERVGKTFVEALVASLLANHTVLTAALGDMTALKKALMSVGIGAVAAGISAVWNGVLEPAWGARAGAGGRKETGDGDDV